MSAVTVRGVCVRSGDRVRLRPLSIDLAPGSVTAIIGPNGAGKSTLLQAIAGELRCDGRIEILGNDIARTRPRALARLRAVLDQDVSVSFGFTVRDVVGWGRECWRGTSAAAEDEAVVEAMLHEHGIAHLAARRVVDLSGGERKRVHLARVRAQQAPVLLLDEADSDLDLSGRHHLDEAMRREADRGTAVIVVSHDVRRIVEVADRLVAVVSGEVVADGSPEQVAAPTVIRDIFGLPA